MQSTPSFGLQLGSPEGGGSCAQAADGVTRIPVMLWVDADVFGSSMLSGKPTAAALSANVQRNRRMLLLSGLPGLELLG